MIVTISRLICVTEAAVAPEAVAPKDVVPLQA